MIYTVKYCFKKHNIFHDLSPLDFSIDTGKFTITVLPPVSTEGKTSDDVNELSEAVRKQMLTTYNETSMQRLESNGFN